MVSITVAAWVCFFSVVIGYLFLYCLVTKITKVTPTREENINWLVGAPIVAGVVGLICWAILALYVG